MKYNFRGAIRRIALFLIPLWIGVGCTPITPQPTFPVSSVNLAVRAGSIQVLSGDNSAKSPEIGSTTGIQVGDRIVLDPEGQGALVFKDRLQVLLHRETEIRLVDDKQEPGGSFFVSLFLSKGNAHILLSPGTNVRVKLETEYATITTLQPGTDFIVCHKPGSITCGVVNQGEAEFAAQDKVEIARGGEAIYVKPSEPPSLAICARTDEVKAWLANIQGAGEAPGLGKIVAAWPQESCEDLAKKHAPIETISLPASTGMVNIPEGTYFIGSSEPDDFHVALHQITMPSFWIDQFEVTNAQYQVFLEATGHPQPAVWPGPENHPVKGTSWQDAEAYCSWANKRLPKEAEWEVAARGPGENPPKYPWGPDSQAGGQIDQLPQDDTYDVGTFAFNVSYFGVYDQAMNVWEWVADPYTPVAEGQQILRGGRHGFLRDMAYRQASDPSDERFIPNAGFRCAADQVAGGLK